ncbi:small integral membrane protein 20-like [Oryctolagus cuniculus]
MNRSHQREGTRAWKWHDPKGFIVDSTILSVAMLNNERTFKKGGQSAGCSAGRGSPKPGVIPCNMRTTLIFGGFVSLIGTAFYPIYFRPLMRLEEYQKEQAINRAGIVQEDVQPPGLKVWSDPFGRK